MNKEFSRVRSGRDILISSLLIIVGATCVILPTGVSVNILGCCLAIFGIVLLFMLKTQRKDIESGIRYKLKIKYYSPKRKDEILKALSDRPSGIDWFENGSEEGLRLDIFYSKAADKVFVRCYEYIPYEYQSCSDWFALKMSETGNLTD